MHARDLGFSTTPCAPLTVNQVYMLIMENRLNSSYRSHSVPDAIENPLDWKGKLKFQMRRVIPFEFSRHIHLKYSGYRGHVAALHDVLLKMDGYSLNRFSPHKTLKERVRRVNVPQRDELAAAVFSKYLGKNIPSSDVSAKLVRDTLHSELITHAKHKPLYVDFNVLLQAAEVTADQLGITYRGLLPVEQIPDAFEVDTSSCYPLFKTKGDMDARMRALQDATSIISQSRYKCANGLKSIFKQPVVLFTRFTAKVANAGKHSMSVATKIRPVLGVPLAVAYLEAMLFQKMEDNMVKTFFTKGLTRPGISKVLNEFNIRAKRLGVNVMYSDIRRIDANIHPIFHLLFFAAASRGNHTELFFPLMFWHMFTPIVGPYQSMNTFGGNVTGSKMTTSFNTFVLGTVLNYYRLMTKNRSYSPGDFLIQGDDFLLMRDSGADFTDMVRLFKNCHLTIKLEASRTVRPFQPQHFLGFTWKYIGRLSAFEPSNTTTWLAGKLVFPGKGTFDPGGYNALARLFATGGQAREGPRWFEDLALHLGLNRLGFNLLEDNIISFRAFGRKIVVPLKRLRDLGWRLY